MESPGPPLLGWGWASVAFRSQSFRSLEEMRRLESSRTLSTAGRIWSRLVPSFADIGMMGTNRANLSLSLTWTGSDSALASPLVLDLARLAAFAQESGESGVMAHTACFFKAPLAGGTHDFHRQHERLLEYGALHAQP